MAFTTSLLVALFCMLVVFAVLSILFALIRVFSAIIGVFTTGRKKPVSVAAPIQPIQTTHVISQATQSVPQETKKTFSSGTLKLNNVDEKTAAMLMAIVSHTTRIPLTNLHFKSVKCIDEK